MTKLRRLLPVVIPVLLVSAVLLSLQAAGACPTNVIHDYVPAAAAEVYSGNSLAQSFSFQKTWIRTVGEEKTFEETLQGTYEAPDRIWVRRTFASRPEWEPQTSESVIIGDRMYVRAEGDNLPEGHEWDATTFMPGEFLLGESEWSEPRKSLLHVACLTDVEMLKDEDSGGMPCYHYRAKLDMDKYVASLDWTVLDFKDSDYTQAINDLKGADVTVEFWANQEDGLIRRIVEDWGSGPEECDTATDHMVVEFWDYNSGVEVVSPVPNPIPIPDIAATSEQYGVTVTLVPHVTTLEYLDGELSEILGWRTYLDSGPYQHSTVYHGLASDLGDGQVVFQGDFGACFGCRPGAYSEVGSLVPELEQYGLQEGQRIRAFAVIVTPEGILRSPCIAFTLVEKVDWNWRYADFELEPSTDITLPASLPGVPYRS